MTWTLAAALSTVVVIPWQLGGVFLYFHRTTTGRREYRRLRRAGGWFTPAALGLMPVLYFGEWVDHVPGFAGRVGTMLGFALAFGGGWAWIRPEYRNDDWRRLWDRAAGRVRSLGHRLIVTNN